MSDCQPPRPLSCKPRRKHRPVEASQGFQPAAIMREVMLVACGQLEHAGEIRVVTKPVPRMGGASHVGTLRLVERRKKNELEGPMRHAAMHQYEVQLLHNIVDVICNAGMAQPRKRQTSATGARAALSPLDVLESRSAVGSHAAAATPGPATRRAQHTPVRSSVALGAA